MFKPKVATKSWFQYQQPSPSIIDPLQSSQKIFEESLLQLCIRASFSRNLLIHFIMQLYFQRDKKFALLPFIFIQIFDTLKTDFIQIGYIWIKSLKIHKIYFLNFSRAISCCLKASDKRINLKLLFNENKSHQSTNKYQHLFERLNQKKTLNA